LVYWLLVIGYWLFSGLAWVAKLGRGYWYIGYWLLVIFRLGGGSKIEWRLLVYWLLVIFRLSVGSKIEQRLLVIGYFQA
jgi:hypothetical protein